MNRVTLILLVSVVTKTESLSFPWRVKQESRTKDLSYGDETVVCEAPSPRYYESCTMVPDFTGEWSLKRVENQDAFLELLGYSAFIRKVAKTPLGMMVHQSIAHNTSEGRVHVTIKTPIGSRSASVLVGISAVGMIIQDDVGEYMKVEGVSWKGCVLVCEARYIKKGIPIRIERYLDGATMVEFVTDLDSGTTMKRIFEQT